MSIKHTFKVFEKASQILNEKSRESQTKFKGIETLNTINNWKNTDKELKPSEEDSLLLHQIIPSIVLKCFSIELGLKAIIESESKTPPKIHNMKTLFEELSTDVKLEIKEKVNQSLSITEESKFYTLLKDHKNIFVDWRYTYELTNNHINVQFIEAFFNIIKQKLQTLKAE